MTQITMMPLPRWVGPQHRQMFALRLAAVYHNEKGSIGEMSEAIGGSKTMLHMAISGGGLTAKHCIDLENELGRELFPREFFRPDIFIA